MDSRQLDIIAAQYELVVNALGNKPAAIVSATQFYAAVDVYRAAKEFVSMHQEMGNADPRNLIESINNPAFYDEQEGYHCYALSPHTYRGLSGLLKAVSNMSKDRRSFNDLLNHVVLINSSDLTKKYETIRVQPSDWLSPDPINDRPSSY